MTNTKKNDLIFSLLYFGDAFVSPFLALYFIHLGFNDWQLSILLAIKPFASLIGNMFYGYFSKNIKRDVNILKIILTFLSISIIGFAFSSSFALCVVFMVIWSLHNSVFFSYLDGIAQKCASYEGKKYSITRMFGSIGYCVCLVVGGGLGIANVLNYQVIFLIAAVVTIISIGLLFTIQPFEIEEDKVVTSKKETLKKAFLSKNFILFLLYYFFVIGVWKVSDDYCSQFFNVLGLSDGEWSFLYAGEVVVEIITISVLEKIIKKKNTYIYILFASALIMTIRTFLFAIPMNTIALIISTAFLRGLGWGTYIIGYMQVFKHILNKNLITKGVTILAVCASIFQTVGNFVYLHIANAIGYNALYAILGGIQVIGVVLYLFIDFSFNKKKKVDNNSSISDTITTGEK